MLFPGQGWSLRSWCCRCAAHIIRRCTRCCHVHPRVVRCCTRPAVYVYTKVTSESRRSDLIDLTNHCLAIFLRNGFPNVVSKNAFRYRSSHVATVVVAPARHAAHRAAVIAALLSVLAVRRIAIAYGNAFAEDHVTGCVMSCDRSRDRSRVY